MSTEPQTKKEALGLIGDLALKFDISLDEIGAIILRGEAKSKSASERWLPRVLGYLGAAFIFGGLATFIGMEWDNFNSPMRVLITYGPGLIAFILGILTLKDERYQKASTPLFLKSALLMPTGMFVYLHEYAQGDDAQLAALVVFSIMALQFLATFNFFRRTSLLFFGYLFLNTALGILMDRANVPNEILGIGLGLSIFMVAWVIDRTSHRAIAPFWYFIGSVGLLWSIFDLVNETPLDITFLAVAIGAMFVSVRMHSRTLLIVSTASLLCFLGYFTNEYFKDVVGWPIALMIMGFMLVGVSAWAVKLGRRMKA